MDERDRNQNEIILDKAIQRWGIDAQLEMVIEECLELALALQKLKRQRGNHAEKVANVIDEIADVKIMIRQAEMIFGQDKVSERVEFKIKRLIERLVEGVS
jgi:NTP pyrophosphatase (non-canonical NTP hydrolase)